MNDDGLKNILKIFIDKWENTEELWKKEFIQEYGNSYNDFKIDISFGKGLRTKKEPWITFLKDGEKTSKGVYPYISYNIKDKNFEVGLGSSTQNDSDMNLEYISKMKEESGVDRFSRTELDKLILSLKNKIEIFNNIYKEWKENSKIINKQIFFDKVIPLNQILYGPPGTGKTYHTIDKVLQIIDGKMPDSREEAKERFEVLKDAGQIEFITFHQSYGYEEFVEGIKATTSEKKKSSMIFKVGFLKY